MNLKTPSPADRDDFDSAPEQEWTALFAAFRAARSACQR